jgi:hypothetical protein
MALKPSEKRLLSIFGGALFLIANVAAYTLYQSSSTKADLDQKKLQAEVKRLQALQSQVPTAVSYREAIAQHLTRYDSLDSRDTYLGTFIQNAVDRLDLRIAKNAPLATDVGTPEQPVNFIKSGYQAEVTGPWDKVLEFIHGLQEPTEFRYVKSMTISVRKSEAQDGDSELVCQFVLQKWWHPDSELLLAEKAEAAANVVATPTTTPEAAPAESSEQSPPSAVKPVETPATAANPP